jgi:phosphatidylinositol glycan class B
MFLSLTSLFHAHILPRALSTSPETLLTALALLYFPLSVPEVPSAIVVGEQSVQVSKSDAEGKKTEVLRLKEVKDMDYVMMDRMPPQLENSHL